MDTKEVILLVILSDFICLDFLWKLRYYKNIIEMIINKRLYSKFYCAWTAVIAITPATSSLEQPLDKSFTGLAIPWQSGP